MTIHASTGAAPPKKTPRTSSAVKAAPAVTQSEARYQGLLGLGQITSAVLLMRGLYADAGAIGIHWPNVARETAGIAATNESFGKSIDYLLAAGPYAGLVTATLPLALQLLANHNRIDAEKVIGFDIMPPEALAAKVKADAERMKVELMRQANEAQRENEQAAREFNAFARETGHGAEEPVGHEV